MMNAIEISDIKKLFREDGEDFWALRGINLNIRKGRAFGLLGPNGAGKTTLIYILSSLLKPTSGTVRVLGYDVLTQTNEVKKKTGICMGGTHFYWDFRPREILTYYARLYGIKKTVAEKNMSFLMKRLGIERFRDKHFSHLSTGMRQKIAVAKSLLNDPEVLLLDEPTAGLDVEVALDVRNFVLDLIDDRKLTVLLTSHQMGEVEHMCKRIAIINKGMLLKEGKISEIKDSIEIHDVVRVYLENYDNLGFLKKIPGVIHFGVSDGLFITVDSSKDRIERILSEFRKRKRKVIDMEARKLSLEEVFLTIVGRKTTLPFKTSGGYDAK